MMRNSFMWFSVWPTVIDQKLEFSKKRCYLLYIITDLSNNKKINVLVIYLNNNLLPNSM